MNTLLALIVASAIVLIIARSYNKNRERWKNRQEPPSKSIFPK